ncbi:MAG TPA: twin-arginine translocase TatA/TatE family subunit [Acidimicrobiia bacterium]|jgi:sec-independent protein translocase protein TatA
MPRGQELIIILVVLVLLFGARKLPELARSLGASAKEFRKGVAEGSSDDTDVQAADSGDSPSNTTP